MVVTLLSLFLLFLERRKESPNVRTNTFATRAVAFLCLLWQTSAANLDDSSPDHRGSNLKNDETILCKRAPPTPPDPRQIVIWEQRPGGEPSESSVIQAHNFLGLVNKAISSARKPERAVANDPYPFLKREALKWLKRAEASILRTPELIDEIRDKYAEKLQDGSLTEDQYSNLLEKFNEWQRLPGMPREYECEDFVLNVANTYQEHLEADRMQLQRLKNRRANPIDIQDALENMKDDRKALRLWNSEINSRQAMHMVNVELAKYAEYADYSDQVGDDVRVLFMMGDHAFKAIAWYRRARELRLTEGPARRFRRSGKAHS